MSLVRNCVSLEVLGVYGLCYIFRRCLSRMTQVMTEHIIKNLTPPRTEAVPLVVYSTPYFESVHECETSTSSWLNGTSNTIGTGIGTLNIKNFYPESINNGGQ